MVDLGSLKQRAIHATLDIGGVALDVLGYQLHEGLFEVSSLRVRAKKHDEELPDPADLVGKEATFQLDDLEGTQRVFAGLVVGASTVQEADDRLVLALDIAPPLWRLGKRRDCRIFQELAVPDICKQVLEGAGVAADEQDWQLTGTHSSRTYVTQYRETDLEFVMRLLAEEGIFFVIHEQGGRSLAIFSDDPRGVGDAEPKVLPFLQEFGFDSAQDAVYRLERTHRTRSDKTFLRQYHWPQPKLELEAASEGTDAGGHVQEVYRYPARVQDEATVKEYAQILLDSLQADRVVIDGDSTSLGLRPGLRVEIEGHPYQPLNEEYLVTSVDFVGSEEHGFGTDRSRADQSNNYQYRCTFSGIPVARSPYRPPRGVGARTIPGLQTAITTGPAGEEIHTNEHGQVTARFHWDRVSPLDDTSSTWMRTSQLALGGSMLLPRVGWEAVVCFDEGDADVPVVMSRFYNAETPPPYGLPDKKASSALQTATTPGGGSSNEIRMCDTKGDEEMFFNGSKDMSIDVVNNATESVGVDLTKTIGANHTLTIADSLTTSIGGDQSLTVGGNQKASIESLSVDDVGGGHTFLIGGARNMMIGGDHRRTVDGDNTETVGANYVDLVMGAVDDQTLASMTHNVSAALIELSAGSRSLITPAVRSETTGGAKIIISAGGRGVEASALSRQIGGAMIVAAKGDRTDTSGATLNDTAAGAQIIKAQNVTYEADALLSVTMGASTLVLTPASVSITGASIKVDANDTNLGMVIDN